MTLSMEQSFDMVTLWNGEKILMGSIDATMTADDLKEAIVRSLQLPREQTVYVSYETEASGRVELGELKQMVWEFVEKDNGTFYVQKAIPGLHADGRHDKVHISNAANEAFTIELRLLEKPTNIPQGATNVMLPNVGVTVGGIGANVGLGEFGTETGPIVLTDVKEILAKKRILPHKIIHPSMKGKDHIQVVVAREQIANPNSEGSTTRHEEIETLRDNQGLIIISDTQGGFRLETAKESIRSSISLGNPRRWTSASGDDYDPHNNIKPGECDVCKNWN